VVQAGLGSPSAVRLSQLAIDPPFEDELNSFDNVFARSGWNSRDDTQAANYGYDYRTATRGGNAWATWWLGSGASIKNFCVRLIRHINLGLDAVRNDANVTVEVSPDANTWTRVPKQFVREDQANPPGSGGYRLSYWVNATEIPDGNEYLRLTVKTPTAWTLSLGGISIGRNGYFAPAKLSIAKTDTNLVAVGWQGGGYYLLWASNLTSSVWTTNVIDGWYDFRLTEPANQPERYYRLLKR
jgi:hypothetical protein